MFTHVELERRVDDGDLARHLILKPAPKGRLENEDAELGGCVVQRVDLFRQLDHRQAEEVANGAKEVPSFPEARRRGGAVVAALGLVRVLQLHNGPRHVHSFPGRQPHGNELEAQLGDVLGVALAFVPPHLNQV